MMLSTSRWPLAKQKFSTLFFGCLHTGPLVTERTEYKGSDVKLPSGERNLNAAEDSR